MENINDDFNFDEEMLDQLLDGNSTRAAEPSSRISRRMDPVLEGIIPDASEIPAAGPSEEMNPIIQEIIDKVTGKLPKVTPQEAPAPFAPEAPQETIMAFAPQISKNPLTVTPPEPATEIPYHPVKDDLEEDFMQYVTAAPGEIPLEPTPEPSKEKAPEPPKDDTEVTQTMQTEKPKKPKKEGAYGFFGIPHLLASVIWLTIIVVIGVSLGRVLWVCCADVMSFGKPQVTAYISVTQDDDIESVAQKMADANLIRYPNLFVKFAEITDKHEKLNVGVFELGSHLDYNAMINEMVYTSNARQEVKVVFPEGYNCAQMFRILEENGVCSVADLEEWAANGELKDYWFLEGVERGDKYCLEGYMAPDTYMFFTDDHPQNVLQKFLDEFDDRFTDIMKENFETVKSRYARLLANRGYSSEYIAEHELTLHQVVTIASVIEREKATDAEAYDIAAVFYNRVTNPNVLTMGSDATVYYAVGDFLREKTELTPEDLESDSPYNTRKAGGIPPGPICNSGIYALYAALDPNDNNYHYFVYDRDNNKHLFSETYDEHLQKVNELGA